MVKQRFSFIIAIVLVLIEIGLDQLGIKNTMISISLFSIAGVLILWAVYPLVASIYKEINAWAEAKKTLLVIGTCLIIIISVLNIITYIKMRKWNPNQIVSQTLLTPKEIEKHLHNWTLKAGFSIKDASNEYARFRFIVTDNKGKKVAVLNRKEDSIYRIFIAGKLMISKNHQKLLAEMKQKEKHQFISYIRIELIKYGISFRGIEYPLQDIGVSDEFVYDESLTMTAYLKNIMFVRRAKYLLLEIILQKVKDIQLAQHAVSS